MNHIPVVSIIIPVYNGSNYLKDAIDSALNQTYKHCEVIVVNDGSCDEGKTEDICLSYSDRIRYFKKDNGGVASAVNFGIREMRGEYFSWLSHDDWYYPEKIQNQIEALRSSGDLKAIAFGNFHFYSMPEKFKSLFALETMRDPAKLTEGIYPALFGIVHACVMLVHKSHIERAGLLDESLLTTQDIEWIFRLFRYQKTLFLDQPLIAVRLHSQQGKHHISCFSDEQASTHIEFLKRISNDEIISLFGTEYGFYHQISEFYSNDGNSAAFDYAKRRFENTEKPACVLESIQTLRKKLNMLSNSKARQICIFCAGEFGRRLNRALLQRDIHVDCFSDNNPSLWYTTTDGVCCVPPKDIDKTNTLIIVAHQEPLQLTKTLMDEGFSYVFPLNELTADINSALPLYL